MEKQLAATGMAAPATPLSRLCPLLVGRAAPLEEIMAALRRAVGGKGDAVLVAGDAGIGKTRLVREACARAATEGALTLEARCLDSDRTLAYAGVLDLVRAFARGSSAALVDHVFAGAAPEITRLAPELAALFSSVPARGPDLDPAHERGRILHAIGDSIVRLGATQPMVVAFEDVHWADEATLDFVHLLARAARSERLLLLVTYRSDEVHPPLRKLLAELERERLAVERQLGPLSADEVEVMIRAMLPERTPRPGLVRAVLSWTEGNPFHVEELLRSLAGEGLLESSELEWSSAAVRTPRSLRESVWRRLDGMSQGARELASLAAVAGRRFELPLLCEVGGGEEAELLPLIREMVAAQLVTEERDGTFAFRHALTRSAVLVRLLGRERTLLHTRIVAGLLRLGAERTEAGTAALAYHAYEAADWPSALELGRRAGASALALHAPDVALAHLHRALDAADRLGRGADAGLLLERARAHETLGAFDPARGDLERALAAAVAGGDRRTEWAALLDLGRLWTARDYGRSRECFDAAFAVARTLDDPRALALSLNRTGSWLINADRAPEALPLHREALEHMSRLGDRRGLADSLDLLGMATLISGDLVSCCGYYEQAMGIFRELDDRRRQVTIYGTVVACPGGYPTELLVAASTTLGQEALDERGVRLAREIGWAAGEAYARANLSAALGVRGAFAPALAHARAAAALAREIGHRQWECCAELMLGLIHRDLLLHEQALMHIERAFALAGELASLLWQRQAGGRLAEIEALAGRTRDARRTLEAPALTSVEGLVTSPERIVWHARAILALAQRQPGRALEIAQRLADATPGTEGAGLASVPALALLAGRALRELGRGEKALPILRESAERARAVGARALLWQIQAELGVAERQRGQRVLARESLAVARTLVDQLAQQLPQPERSEFATRAAARLPVQRAATPRQQAKAASGGLTRRERDVAAHIARGDTNRAIASALFISERTVEGHVARILTKVGCGTRAGVAAWATARGLHPHAG